MSLNNGKAGPTAKPGQTGFSGFTPSNQSLLLDKLNVRRSTPDSEVLASSDDDVDTHRQDTTQQPSQAQKPTRRPSWLNDTSQAPFPHPRKSSFASNSMSPTASHPSTPSGEPGAAHWGSVSGSSGALGRGTQSSSAFPWGSTDIWAPGRKEPPSRLAEVLPSPTTINPPGLSSAGFFGDYSMSQNSPGPRDGSNQQIPFEIPMYPTPKTYRSQSYSVGQADLPDPQITTGTSASAVGGRARPHGGHPGLQHRPSRPSMLSEMSNDGAMLGKVKEVEDDEEDGPHSPGQPNHQPQGVDANKTIEMLTRENAMLRQQQYQNSRLRPRSSTAAAYGMGNGYSVHESVPEESDYAIDELDESHDGQSAAARRAAGRRMTEYSVPPYRSPFENRKLENVKKAIWSSSLGFGGMGDIPQSRRHSFADVPTRQASTSSIGDAMSMHEAKSPDAATPQDYQGFSDSNGFHMTSPTSYYPNSTSSHHAQMPPTSYGAPFQSMHGHGGPAFAQGFPRAPSPHRNVYGMGGMGQPRHNQLLHIVLFKCSRADVFYIQEGTGLTVKPGDLVIVEADRGTDLGTVARDNVNWQTAKELKEHYAEEHYKWLMMYSQNAAAAQEGPAGAAGLMAASNGMLGSAIGGMGPPSQHHMQEPGAGELKPKLIKRLAQSHEIHGLRDKEGNEAKAKRVCMQKVKEHGLNMEILDAEFQMDWKKLTFYYFADAYINFNSLVTDLFKIYKTRIWMSAINPASFASPALGLQAPSGIGPGAVGPQNRSVQSSNVERRSNTSSQDAPNAFASSTSPNRPFQPSMTQQINNSDRPQITNSGYPVSNFSYASYGAFGGSTHRAPYLPGMMQAMEGYGGGAGGYGQAADYQGNIRAARFPSPHGGQSPHDQTTTSLGGQNEWAGQFQGLSLNSR